MEGPDANADEACYRALLEEFVPPGMPLVTEIDVSHTMPLLTIGQGTRVSLDAPEGGRATVTVLEPMVDFT